MIDTLWLLARIVLIYILGGLALTGFVFVFFLLREANDNYLRKCASLREDREVEMLESWLER